MIVAEFNQIFWLLFTKWVNIDISWIFSIHLVNILQNRSTLDTAWPWTTWMKDYGQIQLRRTGQKGLWKQRGRAVLISLLGLEEKSKKKSVDKGEVKVKVTNSFIFLLSFLHCHSWFLTFSIFCCSVKYISMLTDRQSTSGRMSITPNWRSHHKIFWSMFTLQTLTSFYVKY